MSRYRAIVAVVVEAIDEALVADGLGSVGAWTPQ